MAEASTEEVLLPFLKSFEAALKVYSVNELHEKLQKYLHKKQDRHQEIEFVITQVAKEFKISRRTLVHSQARGEIAMARRICYCLLYFKVGVTTRYIAHSIFGHKYHSSVSGATVEFKNLNSAVKVDREFLDKYNLIEAKYNEFIANKVI